MSKKKLKHSRRAIRKRLNSKVGIGLANALALAAIRNDKFLDHLKQLVGGEVKK